MQGKKLPEYFYNWISIIGTALAGVTFIIITLLLAFDYMSHGTSVYLGLIAYMILPVFIILGLLMIGFGAYRERKRILQGRPLSSFKTFTIDVSNPAHRNAIFLSIVVGVLFLFGTAVGSYKAFHHTESVEFCGTMCHSVMKPEHTAYQLSSHAQVPCVACHIGPGADWFVKSKMTGLYQVYATAFNKYPRPIPTPIKNLRPARETCLQCHWPEKFFGARRNVRPHFLSDEKNTPYPISLLVKIGGGSQNSGSAEGIHWHMAINNKVEYVAGDDARSEMLWVKMTKPDGTVEEYSQPDKPLTPDILSKSEKRTMDCMDCHNRPSHTYHSPMDSVNAAMAAGNIPISLPYIKRESVKALDFEYADNASALDQIAGRIRDFYKQNYPALVESKKADIDKSVAALHKIYQENFFPEMKVSWRKYPVHLGHSQSPGCFRCHGTPLATPKGKTITNDCTVCHGILSQGSGPEGRLISPEGQTFKHPVDIGGLETQGNCTSCHSGGAELY